MPACSFYRLKLHMGSVGGWVSVFNLPAGESLLLDKVYKSLLSFENPKQGLFLWDVTAEAGKQTIASKLHRLESFFLLHKVFKYFYTYSVK